MAFLSRATGFLSGLLAGRITKTVERGPRISVRGRLLLAFLGGALMGIGAAERPKAVRWAKAKEIVSTWIITLPGAGTVSALIYLLVDAATGVQ